MFLNPDVAADSCAQNLSVCGGSVMLSCVAYLLLWYRIRVIFYNTVQNHPQTANRESLDYRTPTCYLGAAPQNGHFRNPTSTRLPQYWHGILTISRSRMIIFSCATCGGTSFGGFHATRRTPPTKPNSEPITSPPIATTQLAMERTMTRDPNLGPRGG